MDMSPTTIMWIAFGLMVSVVLFIDLGLNRKSHSVSVKEAVGWSLLWLTLALLFDLGIWLTMGSQKALEFMTGYLIEQSLSVDNLFVFIMILRFSGCGENCRPGC